MPATVPPPGAASDTKSSSGSALGALIADFFAVVRTLPALPRAIVLIAIVAIAGAIAYEKFAPQPVDPLRQAAVYTGGIPDPNHPGADSHNPQNVEADHKSSEDDRAVQWHFNHDAQDHPEETAIDASRKIYYRYFANSDHCVFIRRQTGDHDQTQWVRDPSYHEHDVDTGHPAVSGQHAAVVTTEWSAMSRLGRAIDSLLPAASAGSNCLNPHPGQYRYWWGPPMDQCNSPMYRQFGDGCTHYQIYNRCANAWDSRITWTNCVQQHHS